MTLQRALEWSVNASAIDTVCVMTMMRCRSKRSATVPPMEAKRKTGIWAANADTPSSVEEPVRRKTSHDSATDCIHVPMSEMSWPLKKSW